MAMLNCQLTSNLTSVWTGTELKQGVSEMFDGLRCFESFHFRNRNSGRHIALFPRCILIEKVATTTTCYQRRINGSLQTLF